MPRYDQLFQEIVHTIKEDYAGFAMCRDHHDPRPYVHTIGTAFMNILRKPATATCVFCGIPARITNPLPTAFSPDAKARY